MYRMLQKLFSLIGFKEGWEISQVLAVIYVCIPSSSTDWQDEARPVSKVHSALLSSRCALISNSSNSSICGHSFQALFSQLIGVAVCLCVREAKLGGGRVWCFPLRYLHCKQRLLLHTDFSRHPVSTLTFLISFFYVILVKSDLFCLWKLWNPPGEGSLSTMAICQVQLVLKHSGSEKLHYQLKHNVGLAGGRLDCD